MRWLAPAVLLVACVPVEPPVPLPTPGALGPGLGNLTYDDDELGQPIAWVDNDSGVPEPDTILLGVKPFGTNVAAMHNGYLLTMFAPDSGFSPGGLLWFDVSNPRDIELVHRHYDRDGTTEEFREPHSMGFSDFDGRRHAVFHSARGVEFWDLADPAAPVQLSKLELPRVLGGDYNLVAWQLAWQGPHVYVAGSGEGLYIVDASDPRAPRLADRGGLPNPLPTGELGGFRIGPVFAVGNLLVVTSMDTDGGYATLDISDPANPQLLAAATEGFEKFYSTCFGGGRVVGAVRGSGAAMTTHEVSDPFVIAPVHAGPLIDHQLYCAMQDDFVFSGNENDWAKVDVADPGAPQVVLRGELGRHEADHGQVIPMGNLLWVGNDHGTGSALFVHQTAPDAVRPRVTMVSPDDGAVSQAVTSRVGVTFSDNVLLESLSAETFRVEAGGQQVPGRIAVTGNAVNWSPLEPLSPRTTYRVTLEGMRDWAGNPAEPFSSSFTTAELRSSGDLEIALPAVPPAEVGAPVLFELEASADVEVQWSFEEGQWSEPTEREASWTWDQPGHHRVLVRATDGAQVRLANTTVTVHRPIVGTPERSGALAWADGRVWVANRDNGTVTAVDGQTLEKLLEVEVCATPLSVAGDLWVACEDDVVVRLDAKGQEVLRVETGYGSAPAGILVGESVWVTLEGSGELLELDPSGAERGRTPLGPRPRGLARSADGQTLYVSRFVAPDEGGEVYALRDGQVEVLALPVDTTTEDAEDRARGLPNFLAAPSPSPDGVALWVASKQDNILRGLVRDGLPLSHESAVRAITSVLDTATGQQSARYDWNDRALPTDVQLSPLGDYAFVPFLGSDEVQIIDAYSGESRGALEQPGSGPRSVLASPDGTRVYVHGSLSRTLTAWDVGGVLANASFGSPRLGSVELVGEERLTVDELAGKRMFTKASDPRMSRDGYLSCAVCHLDGGEDGRTWDFTDRGEGLRNNIDLRGRRGVGHGPLHWTANFDEIQDFEHDIRGPFGGGGFLAEGQWSAGTRSDALGDPKAGASLALDQLAAYVSSLADFPRSPHKVGGEFSAAAQAGSALFDQLGCWACHDGPDFVSSDGNLYDVGTITPESGGRRGAELVGFDPPTLRGGWASPPYLHDGSAATLRDVLVGRNVDGAHGAVFLLEDPAIDELEAFLLELD